MTQTEQPTRALSRGALGVVGIVVISAVLMGPAISLFFNTPVMAASAGAAVPLAYLASLVAVLLTAYTVAQYSSKIASAGSFYGFVREAVGPKAGFLVGWCTFGAYFGIAVAGGLISGAFLSSVLDARLGIHLNFVWCAALIFLAVAALSIRGIKISERLMVVMLAIELAAIVIIVGAVLLHGGSEGLNAKPLSLHGNSLSGIRLAMVFGIFAFVGFEVSATLAEETRNPLRNVPIAVIGCTLVVGVIFVVGSYAMVMAYGANHIDALASDPSSFDTLAQQYAAPVRPIVDLIVINAQIGAELAIVNSFARVAFALGREGLIPASFGVTHKRFHTPYVAICVAAAVGILAGIMFNAKGIDGLTAYNYVGTPAILLIVLVFIVSNASVGRYYRMHHASEFRVAKHVIVPAAGVLVLMIPVVAQFYPRPPSPIDRLPLFAGAWVLIGGIILLMKRERVGTLDAPFSMAGSIEE
jgi:amino acid transporter